MKILINRYTDQPAVNICNSVKRYSHNDVIVSNRDCNPNNYDVDIVYYYNICDLFKDNIYRLARSCKYPICVGVQSYKLLFQDNFSIIKDLNIQVVGCLNDDLTNKVSSILRQKYDIGIPVVTTAHTADDTQFRKTSEISKTSLTVGWIGTYRDDKRFEAMMKPIMAKFKNRIKFKIGGKAGKKIPYEQMNSYYNNIDLYVCTSKYEGAPIPPFEACLCGRATISTPVGLMKSFVPEKYQFNDIDQLSQLLEMFINDKELAYKYGKEFESRYRYWRWSSIINQTDKMFELTKGS